MRGLYGLNPFLEIPVCDDGYNQAQHGNIPCYDYRRKIIALRIYFIIAILNFLFITSTTAYFVHRNFLAKWRNPIFNEVPATNQDISRQWQFYSLKKRGMFGTVLGAIGHLIFSTTVFLYQVVVTTYTCDIYLWGPALGLCLWTYAIIFRTYRLHFLIRLNNLGQKFLRKSSMKFSPNDENETSLKSGEALISKDDKDYKWFMKHKDGVKIDLSRQIFYVCASITIFLLILTLVEILGIWVNNTSNCDFYMGSYLVFAIAIFFFSIVVPFIFWYLRHDGDAHGIRREIWVAIAVAVPCFIMCIIWQSVFEYPSDSKPAGLRGVFGPSNWIVIVTTTYHIMTVILPVFKTLSIKTNKMKDSTGNCEKTCCRRKSSNVSSYTIAKVFHRNHRNDSSASLPNHISNGVHHWELNTESLKAALSDPAALKVLKHWAVKDFSVENILFYERYLQLVKSSRFHHSQTGQVNLTHPLDKVDSNLAIDCKSCDSSSSIASSIVEDVINIPLSQDQIPDLIEFYITFITDHSPLQANISYNARSEIDSALAPLAKSSGKLTKTQNRASQFGIPSFLQSSAGVTENVSTFSDAGNISQTSEIDPSSPSSPALNDNSRVLESTNISLQVLEVARKEVFWNIFTGIFPKVVEAYNAGCSH
ncbi:unnamed protein product [Mucor hiemalis]